MKTLWRKYVLFTGYLISSLMAVCYIGHSANADDLSTIIINESSDPTTKPVVRPQKKTPNSKYDVKISPAQPIVPIEGVVPEGAASDSVNGERQRTFPEKSGIAGKIQNKSINSAKTDSKIEIGNKGISDEMKIDQFEKQGRKFDFINGPVKPTDDTSGAHKQLPLSERVEVTRVQSWKLDKSGNRTNEIIKDDNTKVKGINQPPSDVYPK